MDYVVQAELPGNDAARVNSQSRKEALATAFAGGKICRRQKIIGDGRIYMTPEELATAT
jgi:hypothetical protein